MTAPSLAEHLGDQVRQEISAMAGRLRRAADEIEGRLDRPIPTDLYDLAPDFGEMVGDAAHTVQSMMGNLHLDSLIRLAHDADREARKAT